VLPRASTTFWISALRVGRWYLFFLGIGIKDRVWLDDADDGCGQGIDMVTRYEILSISGHIGEECMNHSPVLITNMTEFILDLLEQKLINFGKYDTYLG
jgi:hypothetical protein